MTSLAKTIDSSLTLKNRIATLTFERDDVRNALTGTSLNYSSYKAPAKTSARTRVTRVS